MVLRKPVAARVVAPQVPQSPNTLPYPVTPVSPNQTGSETPTAHRDQLRAFRGVIGMESLSLQSDPAMSNAWVDADMGRRKEDAEIPATMKVVGPSTGAENPWGDEGLPASLRPGPAETPRSSFDSQRSTESIQKRPDASSANCNVPQPPSSIGHHPNNPYLRSNHNTNTVPEIARPQEVSSANIWGELSASPPPSNGLPLSTPRDQSQCKQLSVASDLSLLSLCS